MSSIIRNRLLRALPIDDLTLLQPHLVPVALGVHEVLVEPDAPIGHVHFMEQGIASVVAVNPGDLRIEVANVGREGMAGLPVVLGVDSSPHLTFVQVPGSALRMAAGDLQAAVEASPSLRRLMLRYAQACAIQTAHTALANGRYTIEQRLARWLLMCHDRVDGDEVPLTHEFLALMLGVRRPGVTEALHVLEGERLIRGARGRIALLHREGLLAKAGGCYGVPEAEYARLIRPAAGER